MYFIKFDMQDKTMLMKLLPLYQTYEGEISKDTLRAKLLIYA